MNFLQCSNGNRASRAGQRRAHLLDVARKLFAENGFHSTGVAQIAQASGVKVGQIYRDFSSKEDIIAAIALRDLCLFLDESGLECAIASHNTMAIRDWILSFVAYDGDLDGYRLMPEIMAESARNPRIAAVEAEISDRVRGALLTALHACAPGPERAAARIAFADLVMTLGTGLCQTVMTEAKRERDFRPLCTRLQTIVARELDQLCAPLPVAAGADA